MMNLPAILSNIRLPDALDILFISVVSYHLYLLFRGTKAFKALIGLVLLSGIFTLAESWGLFLTTWVFQILWQVFVILLIILFQKEIRQMLEKFNPLKTMGINTISTTDSWIQDFTVWAFDTAQKRIGALVVFERKDLVDDLITKGVFLESDPGPEILNSIFQKQSPLHDGAILIRQGKILEASCYLPLSSQEDLPQELGTRHRAALGLSEQCDARIMVISEERGEISFAIKGKLKKTGDENELRSLIEDAALLKNDPDISITDKMVSLFTKNYKIKGMVFSIVFIFWLLFAGQQNFEKQFTIPLTVKNLPQNLVLSEPANPEIIVTISGLRKDVSPLNEKNVYSMIDLSSAKSGTGSYNITTNHLVLPNDRVHIVSITPSKIELKLTQKQQGV